MTQELAMTGYFRDQVLAKRPYIRLEWCRAALERPRSAGGPTRGRAHPLLGPLSQRSTATCGWLPCRTA